MNHFIGVIPVKDYFSWEIPLPEHDVTIVCFYPSRPTTLLHQRGIVVSHEAIRSWCYKFGPHFAQQLRRKRRRATDKWHLDEVFVTLNGQRSYLWRAVDSDGMVLDILMQTRRNAKAAKRFFEGVLGKTTTRPRVVVTDGMRSYNIISRERLPNVEHRRRKYLNNRAENSHQPTRRRERRMQRFKSVQPAQLFLSIFDVLYHYCHPKKHKLQADVYRNQFALRCDVWSQLVSYFSGYDWITLAVSFCRLIT